MCRWETFGLGAHSITASSGGLGPAGLETRRLDEELAFAWNFIHETTFDPEVLLRLWVYTLLLLG